jgi:hypothetical protein
MAKGDRYVKVVEWSDVLEDAGGDLKRYIREADERLKASGRPIAKLPKKTK